MYLSTQDQLAEFCERISGEKVVAVDTEFLREKTYFPRLCLVQVGAGELTAAIDPLLIEDLEPLARIFRDETVTKVFHACGQDLEVILDGMGCVCAPVFDTQLAAAFLGMRQQVSYGSLVEAYCGVRLPKAESLTDWSRRPLDPEQLEYAEDDVRYLPGIYDRMVSELIERDRLSWIRPEMEALCDASRIRRDPEQAYLRLRRSASLTRRPLPVAPHASASRERVAINPTGSPALAKGGSGDVLSGLLAGICARGVAPYDAACAASWLLGKAGELAAQAMGEYAPDPTDTIRFLPDAMRSL